MSEVTDWGKSVVRLLFCSSDYRSEYTLSNPFFPYSVTMGGDKCTYTNKEVRKYGLYLNNLRVI